MKETKIVINSRLNKKFTSELTVVCVGQTGKKKADVPKEYTVGELANALDLGDFTGKEGDSLLLYEVGDGLDHSCKRLAFLGVGRLGKNAGKEDILERLREAGGRIAKICHQVKAGKICVVPPKLKSGDAAAHAVRGLTEGLLLGDYTFRKYKTDAETKKAHKGIKEIRYKADADLQLLRKEAALGQNGAYAACSARDMANEPGNGWTPEKFAEYARELASRYDFSCRIFEKEELAEMGMGGIIAVNSGSDTPPKLVVLEYRCSKKAKTVMLVGKGLTFDSGGISIKPAAGMEEMKYDMCGGAAVLATMHVVGRERPDCNVIAIIPATDNLSGGSAVKPGDIITHYNKTTSEVINTDAEGRLILADALAYGIDTYSPDYVVDLATLTGAVIIGLGHHHSGLFSNSDKLSEKLLQAGRECGEPLWRLPLGKSYKKQLESKVADVKNVGGRPAGAITAAEYLHAFVGETAWAHLDIAGTAWNFTEKTYIPEGAPSGICVRTLSEFLRSLQG